MSARRLVAVLACRNSGSRLYGKPLQRLDILTGWRILDQVIANLEQFDFIDEIVLAISAGSDNIAFKAYAENASMRYVIGDEDDVLKRLLDGLRLAEATDLFRVTTESPFLYWQAVEEAWINHVDYGFDASFMDDVIDGCGFEIVRVDALNESWIRGDRRHRSELCTLYIRENKGDFSIAKLDYPTRLNRRDLRLTVDYPEDLIVCRSVYNFIKKQRLSYDLADVVSFLDQSTDLKRLIYPLTDNGYKTMYL
jgi:spore coat polysaccharide biosynthesis protein SpsF